VLRTLINLSLLSLVITLIYDYVSSFSFQNEKLGSCISQGHYMKLSLCQVLKRLSVELFLIKLLSKCSPDYEQENFTLSVLSLGLRSS
jgi:hypothetical protein